MTQNKLKNDLLNFHLHLVNRANHFEMKYDNATEDIEKSIHNAYYEAYNMMAYRLQKILEGNTRNY